MDEVCKRHCIEIVPSVTITSILQKLPIELLKNFSHTLISLNILLDPSSLEKEISKFDREIHDQLFVSSSSNKNNNNENKETQVQQEQEEKTNVDEMEKAVDLTNNEELKHSQTHPHLSTTDNMSHRVETMCRICCERLLATAQMAGFTAISISCSSWVVEVASLMVLFVSSRMIVYCIVLYIASY